ncbi:MAG: HPr family phosphocarrier protein [Acidimicrobiales bacterium]|nr:HPr family phosphocarrier protein [Acidimicrobiales bacterium]
MVGESVLDREDVLVGLQSVSMHEAIDLVGGRLVARGIVSENYVDGMKTREETVSTYLGNGVAMPHGTLENKQDISGTGIVVAQFPDGVDWGAGTAHIVIGLAAEGDAHVQVLSQMAEVLQDEELCEELWATNDRDRLYDILSGSEQSDDEGESSGDNVVEITNPSGLHARPATLIVQLVQASPADLTIIKGDKPANAASIMSVLALGGSTGDTVSLTASGGSDADQAELVASVTEILTSEEHA